MITAAFVLVCLVSFHGTTYNWALAFTLRGDPLFGGIVRTSTRWFYFWLCMTVCTTALFCWALVSFQHGAVIVRVL